MSRKVGSTFVHLNSSISSIKCGEVYFRNPLVSTVNTIPPPPQHEQHPESEVENEAIGGEPDDDAAGDLKGEAVQANSAPPRTLKWYWDQVP
jgi:hypothetical protein